MSILHLNAKIESRYHQAISWNCASRRMGTPILYQLPVTDTACLVSPPAGACHFQTITFKQNFKYT